MIGLNGATPPLNGGYKRYEINDSGISPRALPGTLGFEHVVATDDHDEDGVLISDEYTNPHKRQAMHEKRMRKMDSILPLLDAPKLWGAEDAQVTLVGWGSTEGVVQEAIQKLADEEGISRQFAADQMARAVTWRSDRFDSGEEQENHHRREQL